MPNFPRSGWPMDPSETYPTIYIFFFCHAFFFPLKRKTFSLAWICWILKLYHLMKRSLAIPSCLLQILIISQTEWFGIYYSVSMIIAWPWILWPRWIAIQIVYGITCLLSLLRFCSMALCKTDTRPKLFTLELYFLNCGFKSEGYRI